MLKYIRITSLLMALIMVFSMAACGTNEGDVSDEVTEVSETSELPPVSEEVSEEESEEESEESQELHEPSGTEVSGLFEESSEVSEELAEDAYDTFLPSATENEEFNKAFANNDIDKDYYDVASTSGSTSAIVRASNKAASQWQSVITDAYTQLKNVSPDAAAVEKDESDWNANFDTAIENIKGSAGDDGLANITVSYEIMLFCREKAAELLEQVYNITGEIDMNLDIVAVG